MTCRLSRANDGRLEVSVGLLVALLRGGVGRYEELSPPDIEVDVDANFGGWAVGRRRRKIIEWVSRRVGYYKDDIASTAAALLFDGQFAKALVCEVGWEEERAWVEVVAVDEDV